MKGHWKGKSTRDAIYRAGRNRSSNPKDRTKSKHKPLPGYKQRKRK